MQKKFLIPGIILAVLIVILGVFAFSQSSRTIASALEKDGGKPAVIFHEEKTDTGSIVFYNYGDNPSFNTAFLRKTLLGYELIYSANYPSIDEITMLLGMSYLYFPEAAKTDLPIYSGAIGNPNIEKIIITDKVTNKQVEAKIIDTGKMKLWVADMQGLTGPEFKIVGQSADGEELSSIDDKIAK